MIFRCLVFAAAVAAQLTAESRKVAIVWSEGARDGEISVINGRLSNLRVMGKTGTVSGARYSSASAGALRLEMDVEGDTRTYGAGATIVKTGDRRQPFSFLLRDVREDWPIFIPAYGVAVTTALDSRKFSEIAAAVASKGLISGLDAIRAAPEASFASEAAATREMKVPTWLGLSRDIRLFVLAERLDNIYPMFHGESVKIPETNDRPLGYQLMLGRGWGPADHITRRLDDGVLPILHGRHDDGDVVYELTAFAGLETRLLTRESLRGTHFLVADGHGYGHMFTPEQKAEYDRLLATERDQPEETVLYLRMRATNSGRVPRYAFFRHPVPAGVRDYSFDSATGLATFASGRTFAASRLNGAPLRQEEVAIELTPGETATLEIAIPHRPIDRDRALRLRDVSFEEQLRACRAFWRSRLTQSAAIRLPDRRLTQMAQAGVLHLDLINYGVDPSGPLTPAIGIYTAIGSESSPIIQFLDSMGLHDTARRALEFFLAKQHPNGFMQNFGGYMLETGAVLWSLGEHYRYTRDDAWVRRITPNVLRACDYLLQWRARNQRAELEGKGYGMLEGKTADPEDPFRSFMLNGYAAIGLKRAAEMLRLIEPAQAKRLTDEAAALRADIREALRVSLGRGPALPLGDGTWSPTVPPWVEYTGPLMLYTDGGKWFSHGAMSTRDSLLGPLYLVLQEVLDPDEVETTFLLKMHAELMTQRNTAFSQPYYSRHPLVHLMRGEVKPFLKAYFNAVSALADRETFTFYEHFYGASSHKTHEEAWFLMETRWMLYRETGGGLDLLGGIPRDWLEDGKVIELRGAATYHGKLTLSVRSNLSADRVEAEFQTPERGLEFLSIRLPHPLGKKAVRVEGGAYDPATERIHVSKPAGTVRLVAVFD
jgi:hypothetical protein